MGFTRTYGRIYLRDSRMELKSHFGSEVKNDPKARRLANPLKPGKKGGSCIRWYQRGVLICLQIVGKERKEESWYHCGIKKNLIFACR